MGNRLFRGRNPTPEQPQAFTNIADEGPPVGVPVSGVPVATGVPAPPNADAERVTLRVSGEKEAVAYGSPHKILAMLSLKAPAAHLDVKRPPIDLVACIDRSGSMSGEKMRLMKQTLELLVKRAGLAAEDRISLVTFDSSVKLELPLTPMNALGRANAEGVVRGLQCGSTTNLSGGALKAIDVLDASAGDAPQEEKGAGRTRAVMLFTDGLANEGIRDTPSLVAAVTGALSAASAKLGGPISLFTFGFGSDHNEDCLRALAVGSGASGLYYYVNAAEDIPNAFADCLGGLTSVVAQNATLSLTAVGEGVAVSKVLQAGTYKRDATGALSLGDLFAEDEKDVLVELSLPKLSSAAPAATVLTATLRAFNVARAAPDVVEVALTIARPESTPVDQPVNTALDAQRNRIAAAEAMEQASRMADGGQLEAGRQLLAKARAEIGVSASANEALSLNLAKQCDELEAQYRSVAAYRSVGSKMSKMHAVSNVRQRANHMQEEATFTGGSKRKAAMKASWMSSLAQGSNDSGSDSD